MKKLKPFKILSNEEICKAWYNNETPCKKGLHFFHDINGNEIHISELAKLYHSNVPMDYQMSIEYYILEDITEATKQDLLDIVSVFKNTFKDAVVGSENDIIEENDISDICTYLVLDTEEKNLWAYSLKHYYYPDTYKI